MRKFKQLPDLDIQAAIDFSFGWHNDYMRNDYAQMVNIYPLERYLVENGFIANVSNDLQNGPVRVDEFTITVLKIIKDLGYRVMKTPHSYFTI